MLPPDVLRFAFLCVAFGSGFLAPGASSNDIPDSNRDLRFNPRRTSTSAFPAALVHRFRMAEANIASRTSLSRGRGQLRGGQGTGGFVPGALAPAFKVPTLEGELQYPGPVVNRSTPVVFHAYNRSSAFLRCLWNCSGSVEDFVRTSPDDVHYVFVSSSRDGDAEDDVRWMKGRLEKVTAKSERQWKEFSKQLHFVTMSLWSLRELGFWLPDLLRAWSCQDHNCGLDQVLLSVPGRSLILPRLDARYDWLPSPTLTFGNRTLPGKVAGDGCTVDVGVKGSVAIISEKNCDYFVKVQSMSKSGALAVLVIQDPSSHPPDMNCEGDECNIPLNIPCSAIPNDPFLLRNTNITIQYQNTASENFFAAIDSTGRLAELGWLLHPSLVYLPWQAQWFNYKQSLSGRLSKPVFSVNIFNDSVMRGDHGVAVNITLPSFRKYDRLELDFALSCQGERDEDCPHWDRTIQVFVCCDGMGSELCGAELGRWISPFRRRIGRWLTSVDPLIPLLGTSLCKFAVTGAAPGEFWVPSLNLRFSQGPGDLGSGRPTALTRWINGTFTFDRNYNKNFKELTLRYDDLKWKQVKLFSVITGHGSDENGCGEFCVTSHQFLINHKQLYNMTFTNAGTPLGCAERVLQGVEPNEHGTWLYGRNGWCDGQQVDPWVIDITSDLSLAKVNVISYFGWFRGADPDPKQSPGVITVNAYVSIFT